METDNICKQCGGLLSITSTITFRQCVPSEVRIDPAFSNTSKLCLGHPTINRQGSWEHLDLAQKSYVKEFSQEITDMFIAHRERFYKQHPELQLTWSFTVGVELRVENYSGL